MTHTSNYDPLSGVPWARQARLAAGVDYPMSMITNNQLMLAAHEHRYTRGHKFITIPGSEHYIPPLVPNREGWIARARELVHYSFLGLIADIWTQILVGKKDHKEKDIYLLWDGEIPRPSPLTSLAWLLTCETWPMPTHEKREDYPAGGPISYSDFFPPQSLVMPQSTPYGYASSRPHGMAEGLTTYQSKGLTGLLTSSMHRGDRQNMEEVKEKIQVHRPQVKNYTHYDFHAEDRSHREQWSFFHGWPHTSTKYLDQNIAAFEWQESNEHAQGLKRLRQSMMAQVLTIPGLPTHRDNMHYSTGMWIRNWSEVGLICRAPEKQLDWTTDGNPVRLANEFSLKAVPVAAPRVWFGWTHHGQKFELDPITKREKRVESASESWAQAYLAVREQALTMLFDPESVDLTKLVHASTAARAKLLARAGRLRESQSNPKSVIDDAFAKFLNPKKD